MSSKSRRRDRGGEGRSPGVGAQDQTEAAVMEARIRTARELAQSTVDTRESTKKAAETIYPELVSLYREACVQAREDYKCSVPRSEWVVGASRWDSCEHLYGDAAAPVYWNPTVPQMLLCTTCWEQCTRRVKRVGRCDRCGGHDDKLTPILVPNPYSEVTLHTAVCGDCYPSQDAP